MIIPFYYLYNSTDEIDKGKLIQYWLRSSDDDYETMEVMYNSKRFNWALFVGHLMIEKLLKAYYIKVNESFPPFIHNLLRLAEMSGIELNKENKMFFITVTAFNINARYDEFTHFSTILLAHYCFISKYKIYHYYNQLYFINVLPPPSPLQVTRRRG